MTVFSYSQAPKKQILFNTYSRVELGVRHEGIGREDGKLPFQILGIVIGVIVLFAMVISQVIIAAGKTDGQYEISAIGQKIKKQEHENESLKLQLMQQSSRESLQDIARKAGLIHN